MKKVLSLPNKLYAILTNEADDEGRILIHEAIKSFNDEFSEHHRNGRVTGKEPLHIMVYGANGNIVGGIIANTYWRWLDIDDFWLKEDYRGQGLGRVILETAEKEAISRQCKYSQLKTFSFQARGFYEKCGYWVVGELTDYPPGQALYWMRKGLG